MGDTRQGRFRPGRALRRSSTLLSLALVGLLLFLFELWKRSTNKPA